MNVKVSKEPNSGNEVEKSYGTCKIVLLLHSSRSCTSNLYLLLSSFTLALTLFTQIVQFTQSEQLRIHQRHLRLGEIGHNRIPFIKNIPWLNVTISVTCFLRFSVQSGWRAMQLTIVLSNFSLRWHPSTTEEWCRLFNDRCCDFQLSTQATLNQWRKNIWRFFEVFGPERYPTERAVKLFFLSFSLIYNTYIYWARC